jgi:hypothetical protein
VTDIQIATADGAGKVLEDATIQAFRAGLRGPLLAPGDAGYDDTRKVWNGMIDRRPALIAHCAGVADVAAAVAFARTHGLLVSVRGGGHNALGVAVCEGGLMIDLAGMRSVRVDPTRHTARAEGGTTWSDFDRETQLFGLATTGGAISHTGIGGLTLGGGLGWLAGKHGLACDNLTSVDLVTADATILTASATENAELFWGLRGGGGNFGIATSFEYRLHTVGPLLAGPVLYPFAKAKEALALYRDFATSIADEVNTIAALMNSPDGDPLAAIVVCYNGNLEAGEKVLRPLRAFGPPVADEVAPTPYCKAQTFFDEAFVRGRRYYFKIKLYSEYQRRGDRHPHRALCDRSLADVDAVFSAARQGGQPDRRDGDGIQPSRRAMRVGMRRGLAGPGARRCQYPLGAWGGRRDAPLHDRQRLRQPYRPRGRRGDGSHQGRLRRELRSARGSEEQIRPDEPFPSQSEHQADSVKKLNRKGCLSWGTKRR